MLCEVRLFWWKGNYLSQWPSICVFGSIQRNTEDCWNCPLPCLFDNFITFWVGPWKSQCGWRYFPRGSDNSTTSEGWNYIGKHWWEMIQWIKLKSKKGSIILLLFTIHWLCWACLVILRREFKKKIIIFYSLDLLLTTAIRHWESSAITQEKNWTQKWSSCPWNA